MYDIDKTRDQLIGELTELRRSLVEQGRANLLLSDNRTLSAKRFASGIAHEINNPLGIISGFAELALLNPTLPPSIRGDILVIHSECNRATRILRDLLGFAGDRPLIKVPTSLDQILTQVIKLKSNEFSLYNIVVTTEFSPQLPEILVDGDQLVEVLLNILDNAQQAITGAHGGGTVRIATKLIEDRIRVSVTDNGAGISASDMPKVFNPFFTTKEAGKGTGLGLSISHEIIHQHGGELWAESTPDQGSTFYIDLPLGQPLPLDPGLGDATPAFAAGCKRIMVVNDELGFRQLLARALTPGGNVIDLAADWVEAWKLLQNNFYDRIILNLGLPAVNGMQLFDRIKDYDSNLAGRCIFITGYVLTPDLEEALKATGAPYLTKPFAISQIRSMVLETPTSTLYPIA